MPNQATQAYLAGNKALAKELGAKGRWHAEQMSAAHTSASEAIFRQRNSRGALSCTSIAPSADASAQLCGLKQRLHIV
jgi:hypothetical protein